MKISKDGNCPYCGSNNSKYFEGKVSGNKYSEGECQDCCEWYRK